MFNKMLNNHFNPNKKYLNEKNPMQELLYKQKQLIKIENKKKSLDQFKLGYQNGYIHKNINGFKIDNKLSRSNSVGILLNKNLNFGQNNNNFNRKNFASNAFYFNNRSKNKNYNQELLHHINKI